MLSKKAKSLWQELVEDKGKKRPTNLDRYRLIHEANANWCSKTKTLRPITEFDEDPNSETGYKPHSRGAATSSSGFSRDEFMPPEKSTTEEKVVHFNRKIKEGIENGRFQRLPKVLIDLINEAEGIEYSSAIQHCYIPHKKPTKTVKAKAVTKPAEVQKRKTRSKNKTASKK